MRRCTGLLIAAQVVSGTDFADHGPINSAKNLKDSYDFIIVGGGTAGLTVADRLSEAFPRRTVLVVEFGEIEPTPKTSGPTTGTIAAPASTWVYPSLPIPALNNRKSSTGAGKIVGGSSAVNGQFFDRGSRDDYDAWAEVGRPEFDGFSDKWDWKGILPFFRKSVTFTPPTKDSAEKYGFTWDEQAAYGGNGSIDSSYPPFQWPIQRVSQDAWAEAGVPRQKECDGGDKAGICWVPSSQDPVTAERSHSGKDHYLDVVASRDNYDLLVRHKGVRVVYPKTATEPQGVPQVEIQSRDDNSTHLLTAKLEVIISSGALHTPQILQRSGIGPAKLLKEAGIKTVVDLPGVGYNFQDHPGVSVNWRLARQPTPNQGTLTANKTYQQEALALYSQRPAQGPYTLAIGNSAVYVSLPRLSNTSQTIINSIWDQLSHGAGLSYLPAGTETTLQVGYRTQLEVLWKQIANDSSPMFEAPFSSSPSNVAFFLRPLSRGSVTLNPSDIHGPPILDFGTASNPIDLDIMATFIPFFRKYYNTPSLQALGAKELTPRPEVQSPEEVKAFLREQVIPSMYHPCCSASMMPRNKGGVVGPDLQVFGVPPGLRVVDASIFPLVPASHLSATVYAVAEKAADIIIRKWMG